MKICNNCVQFGKQKKTHSYVCNNSKSERFKILFPHGKTRKACNQYKSRQSLYVDFSQIEGMRFIEDYRGKFQGSDIWVVGSDPNLDCYPDDFFDGKVSITLNYSCVAFPDSTYFTGDHLSFPRIIKRWPHFLKKCIIPLGPKKPKGPNPCWWEDFGLDPIYMKLLAGKSIFVCTEADFEKMAGQVFGSGPCEFLGGISSVDLAIQAAAVLGAKRIILVGCSMTAKKDQVYAQRRGMSKIYFDKPRGEGHPYHHNGTDGARLGYYFRVRQSTARSAEIFRRYGVEVIRHRFDEEKGEFVFEEIRSERDNVWEMV